MHMCSSIMNYNLILTNPTYLLRREVKVFFDERDNAPDSKPIKEVDDVHVSDRVGLKDVESALVTLKQFLEPRPNDVTPL